MSRMNDVGGMQGFHPLDPRDDPAPFHEDWEAHVFAIEGILDGQALFNTDEFRDAIERMAPADYLAASYYERWFVAIRTLLVDKGVLSQQETSRLGGGAVRDEHHDAALSRQVRDFETLLEDRGVIAAGEIDRLLERFLDRASPANGARIAARAWLDDGFRARLLYDANTAVRELGLSMGGGPEPRRLRVVANSDSVHNVIVCTLCSCYPVSLLGPSPTWYKSEAYRSRVVREPRAVLEEFGLSLPESTEVVVWDTSALTRYLVLPRRPDGTGDLDEDGLARLVTRNGLIGTAAV